MPTTAAFAMGSYFVVQPEVITTVALPLMLGNRLHCTGVDLTVRTCSFDYSYFSLATVSQIYFVK